MGPCVYVVGLITLGMRHMVQGFAPSSRPAMPVRAAALRMSAGKENGADHILSKQETMPFISTTSILAEDGDGVNYQDSVKFHEQGWQNNILPLEVSEVKGPMVDIPMTQDTAWTDSLQQKISEVLTASPLPFEVEYKKPPLKAPKRVGPPTLDATRVPNLWTAVAQTTYITTDKPYKVTMDGIPIVLWRSPTGEINALSDVCIHRGASLAAGWIESGKVICPYHGFAFDGKGHCKIPGVTGGKKNVKATTAPKYQVTEQNGWVYLFPDAQQPGAIEQYQKPWTLPESVDPTFRSIGGSCEMNGHVDAVFANVLDLMHISFVHSFGNMNEPVPFEMSYDKSFDDEDEVLGTSQVTFRYKTGPRAFSKVVGRSDEVVVRNEFHLPYTAVIRVYFGGESIKTIMATVVPVAKDKCVMNWKLYRNFMMTHPKDEGPINKAADFAITQMMKMTLQEDCDIIDNIYPEYQRGFMNSPFDKQQTLWHKALENFEAAAAARDSEQMQASIQMELLEKIAGTKRGRSISDDDKEKILKLIEKLESPDYFDPHLIEATKEEGEWYLTFVSNADDNVVNRSPQLEAKREQALTQPGAEAYLLDWNEKGRPLWADTEKSIQIVDTKGGKLTNKAEYKGWSGLTSSVQLDAIIKPLEERANRVMIEFHRAIVQVGGIKMTFPHIGRFSPTGWLETTYLNDTIRIVRGNKGSLFVMTRAPLATPMELDPAAEAE
ncbi:unnamed protein product [Chrysoparadoxa australica]